MIQTSHWVKLSVLEASLLLSPRETACTVRPERLGTQRNPCTQRCLQQRTLAGLKRFEVNISVVPPRDALSLGIELEIARTRCKKLRAEVNDRKLAGQRTDINFFFGLEKALL